MKALDNPVELAETARIFRRALARLDSDSSGGVHVPAPVNAGPVSGGRDGSPRHGHRWGERSNVHAAHGARVDPVARPADPGATPSP